MTSSRGRLLGSHKWTRTKKLRSLEDARQKSSSKDNVKDPTNCHKKGRFARECRSKGNTGYKSKGNGRKPGKQEEPKALVTLDGEGVDWTDHAEDEQENFALMAYSNSGSDTEVTSCSKECVESYAKLKKLFDEQMEQLGDASIEIQAYTQALKKVEAQLVTHPKNQLWYEEKIRFMKIDLDDKTDVLTYHKKLLAEAMSKRHKSRLGYGDQVHDGVLSYENEVFQSVFDSRSSDVEDSHVHDRFVNVEDMHAVPPPMIGNYMPLGPDREIDDSMFTYGTKQSKTSESDTQTSNYDSCESNSSTKTLESMPEPVVVEPNVVSQPKVWPDAPIIEEYESDSDDEYHVKTPRKTVKEQNTYSSSPKANKRDWNGLMSKRLGLGYGFTKKACFVCGSFSHLIRDCDFHDKRIAKQVELNKKKGKGTGQGENRPVWNNVQRLNHQNKFVPTAVLTRNGRIPVNTASQNFNSQAVLTSAARKVNAIRPIDNPQRAIKNKGIVDSGCSRHMNGNKAYLVEYQDYNGGPVAFGGSKGYITGKGKIKTGKLDFEDVCFVKELQHFNLFSVSQMCDKKNKVLFTDTECLVLSSKFKLPDENQVLLRIPRQNNMYSFNIENIVPSEGLACLIAKATIDESNKWHGRLGHVNFKNLNKLVKGNLVRGLPSKIFQNDHTCVACQKGKQHKASCKAKSVSSISQPLQLLHMDLFGPTSVRSINHKTYCLVITDDFSRFSWVFFLRTKDETSGILKDFIRQIENQLNQKVKTIRCDNGTEFKNMDIIELCGSKGIKREYSNARTPQQNGVAERKNMTLIEAGRTMLADSFLPNTFWAKAVSTTCYVLNRVLVTKPQNKTPYELTTGKIPTISYKRPFGCHVTILNTIDHLGKFEGKSDEGFLVGQKLRCKNECEKPNKNTGLKTNEEPVDQEDQAFLEELEKLKRQEKEANDAAEALRKEFAQDTEDLLLQAGAAKATSTNTVNTASTLVSTDSPSNDFSPDGPDLNNNDQDDSQIHALEDIYDNPSNGIFTNASYDDEGAVADFTNLESTVNFRQGAKYTKPEPTLDAFDDLDADGRDYMEIEDVVKEGRQSNETKELNKGSGEKEGSTKKLVSTAEPKTVSTARPDVDTARQEDSAVEPRTPPTTTSIFDDEDINMAQTLITIKEEKAKEKEVSIKDVDDSSRPARSILTLKPLPTIDPKDKGKSVLEEPEPAKKMTIAAQRSAEIRSRPPTKSQLRNLMMTYMKNMGGYKHSQLKAKTFAEIQGLYERQKRVIDDFKPMDFQNDVSKVLKEAVEYMEQSASTIESLDLMEVLVHTLTLEDATEIHMLAKRKFPLTKETLERMMSLKLIAESASKSAYNLLSKELASPKQTALALAIPEEITTGKQISNPFMAGSLPKTTRPT
ncbi:putative ribonuclease H-like domain-containing protein [Tanacetum coccineum]